MDPSETERVRGGAPEQEPADTVGAPPGVQRADPASDPTDLPDLLKIPPVAKSGWLRLLLALGGGICMALGVAGWLIPVVTGIPFYILGLVLLGMAHPPLGHWINRKERTLSPRVRLALRPRLRRARKAAERESAAAGDTGDDAGNDGGTDAGKLGGQREI